MCTKSQVQASLKICQNFKDQEKPINKNCKPIQNILVSVVNDFVRLQPAKINVFPSLQSKFSGPAMK